MKLTQTSVLWRIAKGALVFATLSACGNTTDPTKGGFLGGLGGLTSGNYQQNENRLERTRDASKRQLAQAKEENAAASSELRSTSAAAAKARHSASVMESRLAAVEKDLVKISVSTEAARRKKEELKARIAGLERERASVAVASGSSSCGTDAECAALEKSLERELEVLSAEVDAMAAGGGGL